MTISICWSKFPIPIRRAVFCAVQAVNAQITETYWQVGRHIVEFEQGGKIRADYGKALIASLAKDLSLRHGKGFSRSNLIRIRQFYLAIQKVRRCRTY